MDKVVPQIPVEVCGKVHEEVAASGDHHGFAVIACFLSTRESFRPLRPARPKGAPGAGGEPQPYAKTNNPRALREPPWGADGQGAGDVSEANEVAGGRGPTLKNRAKPAD